MPALQLHFSLCVDASGPRPNLLPNNHCHRSESGLKIALTRLPWELRYSGVVGLSPLTLAQVSPCSRCSHFPSWSVLTKLVQTLHFCPSSSTPRLSLSYQSSLVQVCVMLDSQSCFENWVTRFTARVEHTNNYIPSSRAGVCGRDQKWSESLK